MRLLSFNQSSCGLTSNLSQIALEISERRQADAAIIQQTDEELANLQSLVSANSYSSEPVVAVDEVSKASDADPVVPLSTVAMTGGELTEYMLRIRNRRALNLKDDSTSENRATVDGQSRRNWSLDEEHNNGPSREAGNNYPYASSNRKEERGGPAHEGRSLSGSNFSNADRTVGHGKSGDHARSHNDQSSNWGRDRERERDLRGGSSTSASSSRVIEEGEDAEEPVDQEDVIEGKSRNSEHIPGRSVGSRLPRQTEAVVAEEEYVQDETEVDGEVDEEEDEAELLLAALGGRKH